MSKITEKKVHALMATAAKSVVTMRSDLQVALVAMVKHAYDHGDKRIITGSTEWVKAMHGANMSAVVAYLVKFGGVTVSSGGFVSTKGEAANYNGAKTTDWWSFKPDMPFAGFDLEAALGKLLKSHSAAVIEAEKRGETDMVVAVPLDITKLGTMLANITRSKAVAAATVLLQDDAKIVDASTGEPENVPTDDGTAGDDDLDDLERVA